MKKAKKVLAIVLTVIVSLAFIITLANIGVVESLEKQIDSYGAADFSEKLIPQKDENGYWVFTTDRDFRIMQLTDIHIGGGFMSYDTDAMALNAIAAMITKEKPDLVIATGDIAFPVPYSAGSFNNKHGAKLLAELLEELGVYWTVTFGNHDSEIYTYFDREAISEFYSESGFEHCLYQPGPEDVDGYGNHIIKVKNTKGIITQGIIMIDSHAYKNGSIISSIKGEYDNIHDNQVEWYKTEIQKMNDENSAVIKTLDKATQNDLLTAYTPVKTLAFFHIPLTEMLDGWNEFKENGFKDTADFKYTDGIIGETGRRVYCGFGEDDMFEAMLETGSTKAMFNGHDHYNNTTFSYKGITFSYGYSIDYFAYSGIDEQGSQRGCTIISAKPDGSFEINKYNYYSDRYDLEGFTREEVVMQFEDVTYEVEITE